MKIAALLSKSYCICYSTMVASLILCFSFFVAVKPVLRPIPKTGLVVVHEGEPAELGCKLVKGSPEPKITMSRKVSFHVLEFINRIVLLRARLQYVTKPCNVGVHDSLTTFNNGLGPLKTKSGGGFQGGRMSWAGILS